MSQRAASGDPAPHPGLRWLRADGRVEVRLEGFDRPIARAERLHDGAWVVAVCPLQNGPEKAAIVDTEADAWARLKPWCRRLAWTYRPTAGRAPTTSLGKALPTRAVESHGPAGSCSAS